MQKMGKIADMARKSDPKRKRSTRIRRRRTARKSRKGQTRTGVMSSDDQVAPCMKIAHPRSMPSELPIAMETASCSAYDVLLPHSTIASKQTSLHTCVAWHVLTDLACRSSYSECIRRSKGRCAQCHCPSMNNQAYAVLRIRSMSCTETILSLGLPSSRPRRTSSASSAFQSSNVKTGTPAASRMF